MCLSWKAAQDVLRFAAADVAGEGAVHVGERSVAEALLSPALLVTAALALGDR
jgi:hypothetical protein